MSGNEQIEEVEKMVRRKVGNYEVGRTIGEGTFAKVKFAQNTETGEKCGHESALQEHHSQALDGGPGHAFYSFSFLFISMFFDLCILFFGLFIIHFAIVDL